MNNDKKIAINNLAEKKDSHELENSLDIELEKLKMKKKEKDDIMKALHQYNDIKDATQEVLGRLAILEGVTVAEMHRKYNLLESD
ncbi:DNA repair protein SWI5 homolog isoform X2 [Rhopalosiphum maidis]|uniref:DNA repair protein SWI5 homolog isoform X2 n=1 Tax=Rhopalosiphum maidis TaxID=43146 RepID=UPI000F001654|nr:DNA repair protein SWI5 homolog isoform X2 [Rhopalosiphum maidis]